MFDAREKTRRGEASDALALRALQRSFVCRRIGGQFCLKHRRRSASACGRERAQLRSARVRRPTRIILASFCYVRALK